MLITIAARFQRVSWKYAAMAYVTILKHVGVVYQTMYLVATARGLARAGSVVATRTASRGRPAPTTSPRRRWASSSWGSLPEDPAAGDQTDC